MATTSATSSPIPRRHSEMPMRGTPPRKISTFTEGGGGGEGEMRRGSSNIIINNEQRKARREQFRNFYGLKEGQGSNSVIGSPDPANSKGGSTDIDSSSFDAASYYEELIMKNNLKGLMEKASSLQSDIGNLEGSRHSLVYNHHHQLFSAGDTISKLNSRTPQLLSIVNKLQESFSNIEQLIDSIQLPENQNQVQSHVNKDGREDENDLIDRLKSGKERLRLMGVAKESPEKIKAYHQTLIDSAKNRENQESEESGKSEIVDNLLKEIDGIVKDATSLP